MSHSPWPATTHTAGSNPAVTPSAHRGSHASAPANSEGGRPDAWPPQGGAPPAASSGWFTRRVAGFDVPCSVHASCSSDERNTLELIVGPVAFVAFVHQARCGGPRPRTPAPPAVGRGSVDSCVRVRATAWPRLPVLVPVGAGKMGGLCERQRARGNVGGSIATLGASGWIGTHMPCPNC